MRSAAWSRDHDDLPGGSDADGDGAVGLPVRNKVFEVEVSVMGVAEESKDFNVGETLVDEPLVEVVDLASRRGRTAVGIHAVSIPHLDREPLRGGRIAFGPAELEDSALRILEVVVQVRPSRIEEVGRDRDRTMPEDFRLVPVDVEHDDHGRFGAGDPHRWRHSMSTRRGRTSATRGTGTTVEVAAKIA